MGLPFFVGWFWLLPKNLFSLVAIYPVDFYSLSCPLVAFHAMPSIWKLIPLADFPDLEQTTSSLSFFPKSNLCGHNHTLHSYAYIYHWLESN